MPPYRVVRPEYEPYLRELSRLGDIRRRAQRRLEQSRDEATGVMRDAIEAGVPIAQIADAYGTNGPQVYRWVSE